MAVTVQIRRGTKAQLISYGALQTGELAFVTDENRVYVGDGSNPNNYLVGAVASGTGNPTGNGVAGTIYVDTSASGIWFSDGTGYIEVGSNITDLSQLTGTLDDIADGTSYQRVAATEVDSSGYIIRLNDGSYVVTASGAYTHINNNDLHRQINDSGVSTVELWSSQKINDSISSVVNGVDWQESVLDRDLCEPPGSPTDGDRYIACPTASGGWTGYANQIVEYITSSGGWVAMPQSEGQATWVEDEDQIVIWNGSSWVAISNIANHNNLSGLQGGTSGQYYHLTNADYLALTANLNETISDIVGATVTSSGTGITVTYDDSADSVYISLNDHGHTGPGDGGNIAHSSLTGIGTDDHHAQQHSVTSVADHTVTAASGYVLATVADNTLGMTQIDGSMMGNVNHDDLQNIGENDHHNRQHSWLSSADHTFGPWTVGNIFQVATGGNSIETTGTVDGGTLI